MKCFRQSFVLPKTNIIDFWWCSVSDGSSKWASVGCIGIWLVCLLLPTPRRCTGMLNYSALNNQKSLFLSSVDPFALCLFTLILPYLQILVVLVKDFSAVLFPAETFLFFFNQVNITWVMGFKWLFLPLSKHIISPGMCPFSHRISTALFRV